MGKTSTIQLFGIIGVPKEGSDPSQFVQLQDITSQWQKAKKEAGEPIKDLTVLINSKGGNIMEGDKIYDFLNGLKADGVKITTKSAGMVGSMATKIFMVGDERIIMEGDDFFIHNPQGAPEGDSNTIEAFLVEMKKVEEEMVDFYTSATEGEKSAIALLMDKSVTLTSQQALDMGFATSIEKAVEVDALMMLGLNHAKVKPIENPNIMSKFKEEMTALLGDFKKTLKAELGIGKPSPEDVKLKALQAKYPEASKETLEAYIDYQTKDGKFLTVAADGADPVGFEAVIMEENGNFIQAKPGDYELDNGQVLVVGDAGLVTALKEAGADAKLAALQAEIAKKDKEIEALKKATGVDASKVEALVEEKMKPILEKSEAMDKVKLELEALQSHYKVPANRTFYREPGQVSLKERMAAAADEYKPTKTTAEKAREALEA